MLLLLWVILLYAYAWMDVCIIHEEETMYKRERERESEIET